ncbi:MAG: hypothetical protein WEB06_15270 [Actinomycetota bacterium]
MGIYSTSTDQVTRVLDSTRGISFSEVRFRSPEAVSFEIIGAGTRDAICELTLDTARIRELFPYEQFHSHDWTPDGRTLAYITFRKNRAVVIVRTGDDARKIADLGPWHGNGPGDEHREDRISWSPDGRYLLVATGHAGARPAIRVMDPDGRLVAPRTFGTLARWVPTGDVIYRDLETGPEGEGPWHVLDLETGTGDLAIERGTVRPAVSPDGRFIIVDDATGNARLYLFDLERGTQRILARGYIGGLWLDPGRVSVVKVRPCEASPLPDPCAASTAWHPVGSTRFTIDVETGHITTSRLRLSRGIDLLYSSG